MKNKTLPTALILIAIWLIIPALTVLPQYLMGDQSLCIGSKRGISRCFKREDAVPFMIFGFVAGPLVFLYGVKKVKDLE